MAYETRPALYTEVLSKLTLSEKHREELKKKRGFTDQTIDALKFKSTNPAYQNMVEELISKYSFLDLFISGIIDENSKMVWNFTHADKIIIPYIDANDTCYFWKAHPYGSLAGAPPIPYCNKVSKINESKKIILTESEFKAAGMYQMGFNSIGLSGITTFSLKHFDSLLNTIKDYNHVTILFDTEIQDDPTLASYKDDFRRRYAQLVWAYVLGKRIENACSESKKVRIATLPEEWTTEGKVDVDSALATGKTRKDFEIVLAKEVSPDEYRRMMKPPEKHRAWVNKRMDSYTRGDSIDVSDNCYWKINVKKKGENFVSTPIEISNFIIIPKGTYTHNQELRRLIKLKSRFDEHSEDFFISNDDLVSTQKFKSLCLSKGDFIWKGNDQDMNRVIEQLILDSDSVPMQVLDFVGHDEENEQWIMGNMIIDKHGAVTKSDTKLALAKREFKIGDKGFRINPLGSAPVPMLSTEEIQLISIVDKFNEAWGSQGVIAMTWILASLFSDEIFKRYQMFPFCLIYGEKEAGKTTLSDALMYLVGFPSNQTSMNLGDTTAVAVNRKLNYFHSLPCRFDEYRQGEKKIDDKASILRSIYNRQSASKGVRSPFGVREVEPKGTFILIGEQKPDDPALASRCIPVYLRRSSRSNTSFEAMRWMYSMGEKLSYITYYLLKNYQQFTTKILSSIEATQASIIKNKNVNADYRTQLHYSIILSVLGEIFGVEVAKKHAPEISLEMINTLDTVVEESALNKFFKDLITMKALGEDIGKFISVDSANRKNGLLYFPGLFQQWKKFKQQRGGSASFDEYTLTQYLKSQIFYLRTRQYNITEKGFSGKFMVLDCTDQNMPDFLKDLFKGIMTDGYEI